MRRIVAAGILAGMVAIGSCGPSFENDQEELSYLKALSNPTPAQWKRRNELARAVESRERKEARASDKTNRGPVLLERARGFEDVSMMGLAADTYREIIEAYPGSESATEAAKRLKELEAEFPGPAK